MFSIVMLRDLETPEQRDGYDTSTDEADSLLDGEESPWEWSSAAKYTFPVNEHTLWSPDGVYLHQFLQAHRAIRVTDMQTTNTATMGLEELVREYSVLYVVRPNLLDYTKLGKSQKGGIRSRFLQYLNSYDDCHPDRPLQGVKVHLMVLCNRNASIEHLENTLKARLKANIAYSCCTGRAMGTERYALSAETVCAMVVEQVGCVMKDIQQKERDRRTRRLQLRSADPTATKRHKPNCPPANALPHTNHTPTPTHAPKSFVIARTDGIGRGWQVGEVMTADQQKVVCWYQSPIAQSSSARDSISQKMWREHMFLPVWLWIASVDSLSGTIDTKEHYALHPPNDVGGGHWEHAYEVLESTSIVYWFTSLTKDYRLPDDVKLVLKERYGDA